MPLDRTDHDILRVMQRDARIPNKELAAEVGVSPSTCLERVRRLKARGALRGYHADVSPAALGIGLQAMIFVRLSHHSEEHLQAFRQQLLARPEVISLYHLSGGIDFLAHVAVRDVAHLRDLGSEALTNQRLVAHIETALIFDHDRSPVLPDYSEV